LPRAPVPHVPVLTPQVEQAAPAAFVGGAAAPRSAMIPWARTLAIALPLLLLLMGGSWLLRGCIPEDPALSVATHEGPPAPPAPPRVEPAPQPPPRPPDDKLRIPSAPTNDYSFMQGCWRTDPFQHERGYQPGISTYCFDSGGNGRLEWRRGRTACRTGA